MSQVNEDTVLIDPQKDDWPPISPYETGLKGRCPRCGKGRMFATYLRLCKTCEVCGLDYSYADLADGPPSSP